LTFRLIDSPRVYLLVKGQLKTSEPSMRLVDSLEFLSPIRLSGSSLVCETETINKALNDDHVHVHLYDDVLHVGLSRT
jgi:hypothetical protein